MIKRIHIYDLDGTVINSMHRYRTDETGKRIDLQYWIENDTPEKIAQDSLLPLAHQYRDDLANPEVYVIIATARACVENDANYTFVARYLGLPNRFVHRKGRKDNRKGAALKIAGIRPLLNLRQFKNADVHMWEDNKDYLREVCEALNGTPHYVPSQQGY